MRFLELEEIHGALLETFDAFHEMCMSHGVRYSMDAGTLLGAVRHEGFIPWDDDVDVQVPRPDFELLLSNPDWCPDGFRMGPYMNGIDGDRIPIIKFCNLKYRAQEPELEGVVDEYLWIDVFPADAVPDDDSEALALLKRQVRLTRRADRRVFDIDANTKSSLKRLGKKAIVPLLRRITPASGLYEQMAANAKQLAYGSTARIANISWFTLLAPRWMPATGFDELVDLPFEGRLFKAVSCWDEYLTTGFGADYMTLPPIESRKTHSVKVWRVAD